MSQVLEQGHKVPSNPQSPSLSQSKPYHKTRYSHTSSISPKTTSRSPLTLAIQQTYAPTTSTMDTTATLRSPVHIDRQDPKYRMYHSNRYDDGFGTRYIPPLTRDEHSKREYLGAPYQFAADNEDNPFESSRPTNRAPSPEPGFGRRVFLQGSLSEVVEYRDGEDDFSTPGGKWYWRQREEEEVSAQTVPTQSHYNLRSARSLLGVIRLTPTTASRRPPRRTASRRTPRRW